MKVYRKHHLDVDVLEAARARFDRIMDEFDSVYVAFSGGKDSLVCLHLLREAWERHGRPGPVVASFLDEELIPDFVVDFVDGYRREPWLELLWFAYPLESNKFVLGKVESYVQWDPGRPHVREAPEWALRPEPGRRGPFSQYTMMAEVAKHLRGRIANVTGIRADESLNRYTSVASKPHDNWLATTEHPAVTHCKPIYDWSEGDVFKYLGESGIPYCRLYDGQLYAGAQLRVSTPIHTGSAKRLDAWRRLDPGFHERVTRVFPEMLLQERYYSSLGAERENSFEALEEWVRANVSGQFLARGLDLLRQVALEYRGEAMTTADWRLVWNKLTSGTWVKGDKVVRGKRRRK